MASWILHVSMSEQFIPRTPIFHFNTVSVSTLNVYYAVICRHPSPGWTFSMNTLKVEVSVLYYTWAVCLSCLLLRFGLLVWREGWRMWLMEVKGDPDSESVPGWWPQSNAWLSAECTLKDVKCLFLSFCLFLSLFLSFFRFSPFFNLISPFHFLSRQIVSG